MAQQSWKVEFDSAARRGRQEGSSEPHVRCARYDGSTRQIVVDLMNRTTFVFPCDLAQGLAGARDEDLAKIEVSPSGAGLRWPALDADFSLEGLMRGEFGSESWMRRLRQRSL